MWFWAGVGAVASGKVIWMVILWSMAEAELFGRFWWKAKGWIARQTGSHTLQLSVDNKVLCWYLQALIFEKYTDRSVVIAEFNYSAAQSFAAQTQWCRADVLLKSRHPNRLRNCRVLEIHMQYKQNFNLLLLNRFIGSSPGAVFANWHLPACMLTCYHYRATNHRTIAQCWSKIWQRVLSVKIFFEDSYTLYQDGVDILAGVTLFVDNKSIFWTSSTHSFSLGSFFAVFLC